MTQSDRSVGWKERERGRRKNNREDTSCITLSSSRFDEWSPNSPGQRGKERERGKGKKKSYTAKQHTQICLLVSEVHFFVSLISRFAWAIDCIEKTGNKKDAKIRQVQWDAMKDKWKKKREAKERTRRRREKKTKRRKNERAERPRARQGERKKKNEQRK